MSLVIDLKSIKVNRSDISLYEDYSTLSADGAIAGRNRAVNWECSPDRSFYDVGSYVLHIPNLYLIQGFPLHLDSNCLLWARNLDHDFDSLLTDEVIKSKLRTLSSSGSFGVQRLAGRTLILTSRWDLSFYHFYNETLGKLFNIHQNSWDFRDFDNVLFDGSKQGHWLEYWFKKLNINNKNLIFNSKRHSFLIDNAVYPSYSLPIWEFTEGKFSFISSVLGHDFQPNSAPNKRLFISRNGLSRRVLNEDQLVALAKRHGFYSIRPDLLTVREQIQVFSESKTIVGPHGGAFTNILFSSSPDVFEFFGSAYVNSVYYTLTRFKNGSYNYHVSKDARGDSYYVREEVFKRWLESRY